MECAAVSPPQDVFGIFLGADMFAGGSFCLETSRIPGKGIVVVVVLNTISFLLFFFYKTVLIRINPCKRGTIG